MKKLLFLIAVLAPVAASAQLSNAFFLIPTGVTASVANNNQISVSWTAPANATNLAGYYVYRNGAQIANTAGTSLTDTVSPGAVYSYTVAGYDTAGNTSPQSTPSPLLTVVRDTTPPSTPGHFIATTTSSTITLSWNAASDNVGVAGYYLFRNGMRLVTSTFTATSYTDTGLTPGYAYSYAVNAYDAAGNISPSANVQAVTISDIYPPSAPPSIVAAAKSAATVSVSWQYASDNVGVAGYYLYRNGAQIATTSSTVTTYMDTGLAPQSAYSYMVAAYDAAGNVSPTSTPATVTTPYPDTMPPSVPLNFTARPISPTSIVLSWSAAFDANGVAGYAVYRNGGAIVTTSATSTSYVDTGLASGTPYAYALSAFDASGNYSASTALPVVATLSAVVTVPATGAGAAGVGPGAATSATIAAPTVTSTGGMAPFIATLRFGSRGAETKNLQLILIQQGFLGAGYATGSFGALTQKALQKFQCAQKIVCSGGPASTGWGQVGARTRKALNGLPHA